MHGTTSELDEISDFLVSEKGELIAASASKRNNQDLVELCIGRVK